MTHPATPLDNQASIAQLNQAMNFLVTELIRPNAQQIEATRAICDSNARAIAAEGDRIRELRESVEILRNVSDDAASETSDHAPRITANEKRFENLLAEARADRQAMTEALEAERVRAKEDRTRWQANFDAQMSEIRAQGEQIRALLSALATTNGRVNTLEQAS